MQGIVIAYFGPQNFPTHLEVDQNILNPSSKTLFCVENTTCDKISTFHVAWEIIVVLRMSSEIRELFDEIIGWIKM